MSALLRLAAAAALVAVAAAVVCDNCVLYNGQQCVTYGTCQGGYCLYEYTQEKNGQTMLKKSCIAQNAIVQFDDGTQLTTYNQCVSKTTTQKSYIVKLCYSGDYCNRDCTNPTPLPNNVVPGGNQVTCYSCSASNGADCSTGMCTGQFCTYSQQRQPNGQVYLTKGCANTQQLAIDDGQTVTQINICETITSRTGATFHSMLCNSNYCNAYCTPTVDPVNPQRDASVTCTSCEANNAYDCTGNTCQGSYCIYERTTPANGIPFTRRSCALSSYALYPDGSMTTTTNQCERKTINGVSYAVEVCNSGNFCDTACNSVGSLSSVLSLLILPVIYLLNM